MSEQILDYDLECRIVNMLQGEASADEQEELQRLIENHPEVQQFHDQVSAAHRVICEVAETDKSRQEKRLPEKQRSELLATLAKPHVAADPIPVKRKKTPWLAVATAAAAIIVIATIVVTIPKNDSNHISEVVEKPATKTISAPIAHVTESLVETAKEQLPSTPLATIEIPKLKNTDFDPPASVDIPNQTENEAHFLSKSGEPLPRQKTSSPEKPKQIAPQLPPPNIDKDAPARAELNRKNALIQTASLKLQQTRSIQLQLPEIQELHQKMDMLRQQIMANDDNIAMLETLRLKIEDTDIETLTKQWQERTPVSEKTFLPVNSVSEDSPKTAYPPGPGPEASIEKRIDHRNTILQLIRQQQANAESSIRRVFPDGQYQTKSELEMLLTAMQNNLKTTRRKYQDLEFEIAKSLVHKGADIELPSRTADDATKSGNPEKPAPFQSTIEKVYHQWGFAVIKGGRKEGLTPGDKLYVTRQGRLVGKLKVTKIDEKLSVANIEPGSVPFGGRLAPGDIVVSSFPK